MSTIKNSFDHGAAGWETGWWPVGFPGLPLQPLLLVLESRILLDGAGADALFFHDPVDPDADHDQRSEVSTVAMLRSLAPPEPSAIEQAAIHQRREVVFVDAMVKDYHSLLQDVGADRMVVVLDAHADGVEQITHSLSQMTGVDAIHIISHGKTSEVRLGSAVLSSETLATYAQSLETWKSALTLDADLLFYGCDVGQGEAGHAFMSQVATLTGADVAASDNATGAATQGGDWVLEQTTGAIETTMAPDAVAREHYSSILNYTVTSTADSGANTLRQAIADAKANPGADTIDINVATPIVLSSQIDITDTANLVINGNNATISSAVAGTWRAFYVNLSATTTDLTMNNLTIDGFQSTTLTPIPAGGGIYLDQGILNLNYVTVSNNTHTVSVAVPYSVGGGIFLDASATLNVNDSTISTNSAIRGGGIRNEGGTVTITRSTIKDNSAITANGLGGGLSLFTGSMSVVDSTVSGNQSA
ncbi:MAG: DUF4347 domain-containing protein, partial [Magnetococcus sp. YQC-5]